jgi:DnaJ-domain-containing protein 1
MAAIDAVSVAARRALLEVMLQVAWADRELAPEERQAAQAAAMALGLVLPGERDLTAPDQAPPSLEMLDFSGLSPRDRELVYVCAEWMAQADSVEQAEEAELLARLRDKLGVETTRATELRTIAVNLHAKQVVERGSWWRAFDRLVMEAARSLAAKA